MRHVNPRLLGAFIASVKSAAAMSSPGIKPPTAFRTGQSQAPIPPPVNAVPQPAPGSSAGKFRVGVSARPDPTPPINPLPPKFPEPTLSSVTPAHYKQPYYGAAFNAELQKAQNYNESNGLPGDQNKWAQPVPIERNSPDAAMFGPHYDRTGVIHMPSEAESAKSIAHYMRNPASLADTNMRQSQVAGELSGDASLKHESYHPALTHPAVTDYDSQALRTQHSDSYVPFFPERSITPKQTLWDRIRGKPAPAPVTYKDSKPESFYPQFEGKGIRGQVYRNRLHDTDPDEMRNYMSQLQEHQFQNTGKRFESPQDYDKFLQGVNPTQPDEAQFEKGIQQYPVDAQRMFRQMRKTNEISPAIYDNIRNWQRTVVPGIVQNGQEINKTASLRELSRRLAKL